MTVKVKLIIVLYNIYVNILNSSVEVIMKKTKENQTTFRQKRSDTKIETVEKQYGKDFGVRGDMKLGTFLEKKGYKSLTQLLKTKEK